MFLYVIGPQKGGPTKIGFSVDPEKRLSNLQTGNPNILKIHYLVEVSTDKVRNMERIIHKTCKMHRLKGEWFNFDSKTAIQEVQFAMIRYEDDPLLKEYAR